MDHDDEDAQEWQETLTQPTQNTTTSEHRPCDDYWFIPPYTDTGILNSQLYRIEEDTNIRAVHNTALERVDLWGNQKNIQRAKQALDHLGQFYHGRAEMRQKATRTKNWTRPERELTPAEKKKRDRELKRQEERQRYLGDPTEEFPFTHCLAWPTDIPIFRHLGGKLERLDALRAEFRSFIWLDKDMNLYVGGEDEESSTAAMDRIKNFLIKQINKPANNVCHILEKPSKLVQIHFVTSSPVPYISADQKFYAVHNEDYEPTLHFLKAKEVGDFGNVREVDLRMSALDAGNRNGSGPSGNNGGKSEAITGITPYVRPMQYSERMTQSNIARIQLELESSLEAVQLMDHDLKMCIRIGQIGLTTHPKQLIWEIEELDTSVIPSPKLKSEFSPHFIKSSGTFAAAERRLTQSDDKKHVTRTDEVWFLRIMRRINMVVTYVTLEVTFRSDGHVGLWNGLVEQTTPLDIRVICSERRLSWAWTISAGKRHSDQSPEEMFIRGLRLSKDVLRFANTDNVQLQYVRRERKKFIVRDQWTIEMAEESFWSFRSMEEPFRPYQIASLNPSPDRTLYSISMYRDSWKCRFSENPYLGLGQVPSWEPEDFFKEEESIEKTLEAVAEVRSLIEGLF
ncbi:hypothetical protein FBU30_004017 [Linnemannia zychae]|nr:hypothetical protein FBU30_004017 [Linnemannia zychae]